MSGPNPLPSYVYKILPNSSPYQGVPIPIPSSWRFAKTEADLKDGFVHLYTVRLLSSALSQFYTSKEDDKNGVQLLKVDFERLSTWKRVSWERETNEELYPHLYHVLQGEEVVDLKIVKRGGDEEEKKSWESVCEKLEADGWLKD